jgi:hypothetical protein
VHNYQHKPETVAVEVDMGMGMITGMITHIARDTITEQHMFNLHQQDILFHPFQLLQLLLTMLQLSLSKREKMINLFTFFIDNCILFHVLIGMELKVVLDSTIIITQFKNNNRNNIMNSRPINQ